MKKLFKAAKAITAAIALSAVLATSATAFDKANEDVNPALLHKDGFVMNYAPKTLNLHCVDFEEGDHRNIFELAALSNSVPNVRFVNSQYFEGENGETIQRVYYTVRTQHTGRFIYFNKNNLRKQSETIEMEPMFYGETCTPENPKYITVEYGVHATKVLWVSLNDDGTVDIETESVRAVRID